jgi:hypothetical protein
MADTPTYTSVFSVRAHSSSPSGSTWGSLGADGVQGCWFWNGADGRLNAGECDMLWWAGGAAESLRQSHPLSCALGSHSHWAFLTGITAD